VKSLLIAAFLLGSQAAWSADPAPKGFQPSAPWWDSCAVLASTGDPAQAHRIHADAVTTGAGDDPAWGSFSEHERVSEKKQETALLHQQGIKVLSYIEAYGETTSFVAQIRRDPDGNWIKVNGDPTRTRLFSIFWNWEHFDGTGVIHWIGVPDYFQESDVVAPWTRSHPRYGCPMMTYPDGRPASGQSDPADPRTNAVYDAGCSKDVNGHVTFDYDYRPDLPLAGLIKTAGTGPGVPDPGYTPVEWTRLKDARYAGLFNAGKDSACPIWIDYIKASVRQQLDAGLDGLWVDNYSPWDSLNVQPILKAFGEWSVAGFRDYLPLHFTPSQLAATGVSDLQHFDIRTYLQNRCRQFGGDPANLKDRKWLDPRWSEDPLWRAYLIYKRQTGTKTLSAFYHTIKTEAAAAGKPDFLVSGNDIPGFSLGWPRGDLDMVSTELSSGWGITAGPRGLMFPPFGSYVPVYQLAREHARSRYVNAWLYVPPNEEGKPNLARVLYAQALAFDATAMPHYGGSRTAGAEESDAPFFAFMHKAAPVFAKRKPIEEVGLYYSSSSQILELLPGGLRAHNDQPHSFSIYGWGTALAFLHVPWQAVPEWKLNLLDHLRVLIIPSAAVFPSEDLPSLTKWVKAGGSLVIAGKCGTHLGESGNFDPAPSGSTLQPLLPGSKTERTLGKGTVIYLPVDPGYAFYQSTTERPKQLPEFANIIKTALKDRSPLILDATNVDWKTGINLHGDDHSLFVDICNTNIDIASDTLTPATPITFSVALPSDWGEKLPQITSLSPDAAPILSSRFLTPHRLQITVGPTTLYTSVIIHKS
jgi:hypothetical protein